jgi:hypothetical protein
MPSSVACLFAASALALTAGAALAQSMTPPPAPASPPKPAPSTTVAPVTVEAPAPPKVVELRSYHFVQKNVATGNPELEQIVRWRDPVCVRVAGLIANQEEEIRNRIASVAQAVDLHVGKPGCRANIEIVFTDQPQTVMDTVYKRREYMLGYYHRHDGVRLKKVTRPIQAWHVTATVGGWGAVGITEGPSYSEVVDDPDNHPPSGCGDSPHFTSCLRSVFKNVFVIVDNKFLGDNSLGLVTDYLVMVALAEPDSLAGCNELPSVIDLFAQSACPGRDAPDGLTPADASFLTALYSADPEQKRWSGENDIAGRMAKILIKAKAVAK